MFKNSVFRVSVDTKKWLKAAGTRAVRTMAQVAIAQIGVATVLEGVDWKLVVSATLLSGILSILTSLKGIPEVESEETK